MNKKIVTLIICLNIMLEFALYAKGGEGKAALDTAKDGAKDVTEITTKMKQLQC